MWGKIKHIQNMLCKQNSNRLQTKWITKFSGQNSGKLESILVGWLQLASGAFVCYLAVKYFNLKIMFSVTKYLKVKMLSLDIKYMTFFGVTLREID